MSGKTWRFPSDLHITKHIQLFQCNEKVFDNIADRRITYGLCGRGFGPAHYQWPDCFVVFTSVLPSFIASAKPANILIMPFFPTGSALSVPSPTPFSYRSSVFSMVRGISIFKPPQNILACLEQPFAYSSNVSLLRNGASCRPNSLRRAKDLHVFWH